MENSEITAEDIADIFGGEASSIDVNPDELEVSLALQKIRDLLLERAEKIGVGVNQLARRLGIAPSAVSRFLGAESDMRVSTAVLYARALGGLLEVSLAADASCHAHGNHGVTVASELIYPTTSELPNVFDLTNLSSTGIIEKSSLRQIA